MKKYKSDYTAIVRDEHGVNVLKCCIVNETHVYFQMFNKTKNIMLPMFEIPANWGILEWNPHYKKIAGVTKKEWDQSNKENNDYFKNTKNINRMMLVQYYKNFMLQHLITQYHSN